MRRFKILAEIGKGGFGRVLAVREEGDELAPILALKLLSGRWREDDEPVRRLRDEARLLAQLRHPGVVRLYSYVRLDAGPGLLMELVDGPNLADALRLGGRLPTTAALELVARVAEALDYAWRLPGKDGQPLKLLHRDIKPANLAITRHGEVKLLDFGIAWGALEAREARSGSEPRGTVTYMAPERHRGQDSSTVDVYGLGLVLANLLLGAEHPELPKAEDEADRFREALATELIRALGPGRRETEMITSLVLSCVEWSPDARPSPRDVAELTRALATEIAGTNLTTWAARRVPELHERATALAQAGAVAVGVVLSEVVGLRQARVVGGEAEAGEETGEVVASDPMLRPVQVNPTGVPFDIKTLPEAPEVTPLPSPAVALAVRPPPSRPAWGRRAQVGAAVIVLGFLLAFSAWWMGWGRAAAERAALVQAEAEATSDAAPAPAASPTPAPPVERSATVVVPTSAALPASGRVRRRSGDTPPVTSVTAGAAPAHVRARGDAERIALVQGDREIALPAEVQPGAYTVLVTLPGGEPPFAYGELTARAGASYEIRCLAAMATCRTLELP